MNAIVKPLSCAVVVFSLLLGSVQAVAARRNANLRTATVESSMRVHDLEAAQDALQDANHQQLEIVETLAAEFATFLRIMQEAGVEVAEATNDWIASPNRQTEAAVTLAIARATERGHKAAQAVAALGAKMGPATRVLSDRLQGHIREMRDEVRNARRKALRLENEHQRIREMALEAKHILEARGYTATSSLPPELADSLSRLEMEYFESATRVKIQRELGPLLEEYGAVLEQADRDYRRIGQLTQLMTDQASSVGRVLSHLGMVEARRIEAKLSADVFAKSAGLRNKLTTVAGQLNQAQRNISQLVTARRRLPQIERPAPPQAGEGQAVSSWTWLWNLDEEDTL